MKHIFILFIIYPFISFGQNSLLINQIISEPNWNKYYDIVYKNKKMSEIQKDNLISELISIEQKLFPETDEERLLEAKENVSYIDKYFYDEKKKKGKLSNDGSLWISHESRALAERNRRSFPISNPTTSKEAALMYNLLKRMMKPDYFKKQKEYRYSQMSFFEKTWFDFTNYFNLNNNDQPYIYSSRLRQIKRTYVEFLILYNKGYITDSEYLSIKIEIISVLDDFFRKLESGYFND